MDASLCCNSWLSCGQKPFDVFTTLVTRPWWLISLAYHFLLMNILQCDWQSAFLKENVCTLAKTLWTANTEVRCLGRFAWERNGNTLEICLGFFFFFERCDSYLWMTFPNQQHSKWRRREVCHRACKYVYNMSSCCEWVHVFGLFWKETWDTSRWVLYSVEIVGAK